MRNLYFVSFLLCLFCSYDHLLNAQEVPQIIPPAPNASSLGKYGDIPVGLYTGLPNINVPLHEINEGSLKIPISLSYHAAGIKVEEMASNVGLGWTLNAGGAITRSVRGLPDEKPNDGSLYNGYDLGSTGFYTSINQSNQVFHDLNNNLIDLQPDVYNFNFVGHSGKLIIDRQTRKGYVANNDQKMDIIWNGSNWIITDASGIKYYFGNSQDGLRIATDKTISYSNGGKINNTNGFHFPTAWYLLDILHPNGESIHFYYANYSITYSQKTQESRFFIYLTSSDGCSVTPPVKIRDDLEVLGSRLIKIEYSGKKVLLNYKSEKRIDLFSDVTYGDNALESIEIYNDINSNQSIRKIQLDYSYFIANAFPVNDEVSQDGDAANYRLRLDKITEFGDSTLINPPYVFTYDPTTLPNRFSNSQDHWGFYNGSSNETLIPKHPFSYGGVFLLLDGANRQPNFTNCKAGILTEMKYPTGGKTKFEYELHDAYTTDFPSDIIPQNLVYATIARGEVTGGFISKPFTVNGPYNIYTKKNGYFLKITTVLDTPCNTSEKDGGCGGNLYAEPVSGTTGSSWTFGSLDQVSGTKIDEVFFENGSYRLYLEKTVDNIQILSCTVRGPDPRAVNEYNKPIGGLRIKSVSNIDANGAVIKKDSYKYKQFDNTDRSSGVLVSVPRYNHNFTKQITLHPRADVTVDVFCEEFVRTATTNIPLGMSQGSHIGYENVEIIHGGDEQNYVLGKTSNIYTTAKDYPDIEVDTFPAPPATSYDWKRGLLLSSNEQKYQNGIFTPVKFLENKYINDSRFQVVSYGIFAGSQGTYSDPYLATNSIAYFSFADVSKWLYLKEQDVNIYDQNDPAKFIRSQTEYFYDNALHLQPTRTIQTFSNGKKIITKMLYPLDFSSQNGGSIITDMQSDARFMHNSVLQKTIIEDFNGTQKVLSSQITKYDYVIGSNSTTLILPKEIASLETNRPLDITEFPVYIPVNGYDATKFTKRLTYDQYDTQGNIWQYHKEGDAPSTYLWGYNNTYPIAEIKNATYAEVRDALGGQTVVDALAGSTTLSSAQITQLNNLRSNATLKKAFISTYTYKPLVGMLTATDANGVTITYEYDSLGRLQTVKDLDGYVIKTYTYHYKE